MKRQRGRSSGSVSERRPRRTITSIATAFLVAGLVGFLIVVFLEVPLLAVVQVFRAIVLAFAHTLLVCLVFRVIRVLVLEKWSSHSLYCASTDTQHQRHNPNAMVQVDFHKAERGTPMAVQVTLVARTINRSGAEPTK
jgi:hypothetical protein